MSAMHVCKCRMIVLGTNLIWERRRRRRRVKKRTGKPILFSVFCETQQRNERKGPKRKCQRWNLEHDAILLMPLLFVESLVGSPLLLSHHIPRIWLLERPHGRQKLHSKLYRWGRWLLSSIFQGLAFREHNIDELGPWMLQKLWFKKLSLCSYVNTLGAD